MAELNIKQGDTVTVSGSVSHASTTAALAGCTSLKLYARRSKHAGSNTPNQINGVEVDSFSTSADTWSWTPSTAHVNAGPISLNAYLLAAYAGGATARFPSEGYAVINLSENFESS